MNTMREMHDIQKLLASAKQSNKKWWKFWK
ncbi:DUF3967 domain-containing protein [Priestia filamentosa]